MPAEWEPHAATWFTWIIGSTDPKRIVEATKAPKVDLTRDEWYRLLLAARGEKLP